MLRHGPFPKIALDSMDRFERFMGLPDYGDLGRYLTPFLATLMATKLAPQNPMIVTLFTGRWALSLV
jgi:hypothetical protein